MIQNAISNPKVREASYGGDWVVVHPCNDAILAYCDTEQEARDFAAACALLVDACEEDRA